MPLAPQIRRDKDASQSGSLIDKMKSANHGAPRHVLNQMQKGVLHEQRVDTICR
jgi:hypothetical protein